MRRAVPIVAALVALALAGCGGDGDDAPEADPSTPEGAAQAYIDAVRDGDSETACELTAPDVVERDFGSVEECESGFEGDPTGFLDSLEVGESTTEGDLASVEVLREGEPFTTYELELEGDTWVLGDDPDAPELPAE